MLSILIPTYNYNIFTLVAEVHRQCVESNIIFEIIAADDGSHSTVNSENQHINNLTNSIFKELPQNIGRTAMRNFLARSAKYDWLLFLDADVLPVSATFVSNYTNSLAGGAKLVFGGYSYKTEKPGNDRLLRHRYGTKREEKSAVERRMNPYTTIFSGNLLIDKQAFFDNNYPHDDNFYGLDVYFGYRLLTNKVPVLHIDNPIWHLGLETNEVFFKKALEAVVIRKKLLANEPDAGKISSLLKYYLILKKWKLCGLVSFFFSIAGPLIKKRILNNKAGLVWFDIYRLGYICHIKE